MADQVTENDLRGFEKDPNKVRETGSLENENDFTAGPWSPGKIIPSNPKLPKN